MSKKMLVLMLVVVLLSVALSACGGPVDHKDVSNAIINGIESSMDVAADVANAAAEMSPGSGCASYDLANSLGVTTANPCK